MGAHALRIERPGERTFKQPEKRGRLREFTNKARQRLTAVLNKVRMDDATGLPLFVTCTFPDRVPEPDEELRIWEVFWKKIERRFPSVAMLWRKELKDRKSGGNLLWQMGAALSRAHLGRTVQNGLRNGAGRMGDCETASGRLTGRNDPRDWCGWQTSRRRS